MSRKIGRNYSPPQLAILHCSMYCRTCGSPLMQLGPSTVRCPNAQCREHKMVYEAPTIEMKFVGVQE